MEGEIGLMGVGVGSMEPVEEMVDGDAEEENGIAVESSIVEEKPNGVPEDTNGIPVEEGTKGVAEDGSGEGGTGEGAADEDGTGAGCGAADEEAIAEGYGTVDDETGTGDALELPIGGGAGAG